MKQHAAMLSTLLVLLVACTGLANDPSATATSHAAEQADPKATAGEEAPKIPGITRVKPGTKIDDIKSDPFTMNKVVIEGGVMKIDVSYAGGAKKHEFKLYWNGIVARSYPGKTNVYLKHDANGDMAEALLTETLQFDLAEMNKPMIITVRTDHGDKTTVQYGER